MKISSYKCQLRIHHIPVYYLKFHLHPSATKSPNYKDQFNSRILETEVLLLFQYLDANFFAQILMENIFMYEIFLLRQNLTKSARKRALDTHLEELLNAAQKKIHKPMIFSFFFLASTNTLSLIKIFSILVTV